MEIFSCGTFNWLAVGAVGAETTLDMCCPSMKENREPMNRQSIDRLGTTIQRRYSYELAVASQEVFSEKGKIVGI
jgi:hypothetical protein